MNKFSSRKGIEGGKVPDSRKDIVDNPLLRTSFSKLAHAAIDAVLEDDFILQDKVKKIENLDIGVSPKAELILILAGKKPATDVMIFQWNSPLAKVYDIIKEVGLKAEIDVTRKVNEKHMGTIRVAKDTETLRKLSSIKETNSTELHKTYGLLMGFPETAVEAFVQGDLLDEEEYPQDKKSLFSLFQFKLSRNHWSEEITVLDEWNNTIRKYAPELFEEVSF